ncbi:MAG: rhodanese-like domain-containing protein [Rhizobiaceae bacterium]
MISQARRFIATLLVAHLLAAGLVFSALAENIMSAKQALDGVENGTAILVDIRTKREWRQTGIATVATPLSMHEDGFLEGIKRLRSENPDKTIALICAVGGRTAYMSNLLEEGGFSNIADVSEGMIGGQNGMGWIPSGLPVKPWNGQ